MAGDMGGGAEPKPEGTKRPARRIYWVMDLTYATREVGVDADEAKPDIRSGDRDAFAEALRPLIQPGFRLALGMLDDNGAAEDAVQEASIRAWRNVRGIRDVGAILPWFLSIVANECRKSRRRRRWSVGINDDQSPAHEGPEAAVLQQHDLRVALATLNDDQRLVVTLHYYVDMRLEDIALVANVPLGTVKSRLGRALEQLRPLMEMN